MVYLFHMFCFVFIPTRRFLTISKRHGFSNSIFSFKIPFFIDIKLNCNYEQHTIIGTKFLYTSLGIFYIQEKGSIKDILRNKVFGIRYVTRHYEFIAIKSIKLENPNRK